MAWKPWNRQFGREGVALTKEIIRQYWTIQVHRRQNSHTVLHQVGVQTKL